MDYTGQTLGQTKLFHCPQVQSFYWDTTPLKMDELNTFLLNGP